MSQHFQKAILALAETIAHERGSIDDRRGALGVRAAEFLLRVHRQMPDYLRPPFHILVLLFNAWPLLSRGRFFHHLPLEDRLSELDKWRRSRLEFKRRFVEFHVSLALFGIYSDLYGQDYQHEPVATGAPASP
ncbi:MULTISPECIES: hypothetical protein [unclassified Ensifer]|uniref:hypothetical protein n=1 Tax=unclassified Ensifer TaxID=2633371 RepID=UPI0008132B3A|nr:MULTISPECIES: hypothetical protein [unclassified Ensifer]OCP02316.1 hypothetical protein BC362_18775 [Ensifer sp. LC14]OCP14199.1 hypothetical protein BC374_00510 [Ensifer sp. LC13]OCP14874.1 hypothetical protein BBX50_00860 [Ensifer sp. LC11]OCP34362.1 hypothetical protein BC364_00510 [Ensifer sp. LC499]